MVVQHNLQAANTNRMLGQNVKAVSKSTEKLSSGYQVNRATGGQGHAVALVLAVHGVDALVEGNLQQLEQVDAGVGGAGALAGDDVLAAAEGHILLGGLFVHPHGIGHGGHVHVVVVEAAPVVESAPAEEAKPEVKEEPVVEEKPAEPVKAEEVKAEPVKAAAPAAKAPAKKPAAKKTSRAARKKAAAAKK